MSGGKHPDVDTQQAISEEAIPATLAETEKEKAAQEFSQSKSGSQLSMRVVVRSPFQEYFDGQALSLTAETATGPFDVLPKHHNFIALLSPCELVIRSVNGENTKINISGGIIHIKADEVVVFLDV